MAKRAPSITFGEQKSTSDKAFINTSTMADKSEDEAKEGASPAPTEESSAQLKNPAGDSPQSGEQVVQGQPETVDEQSLVVNKKKMGDFTSKFKSATIWVIVGLLVLALGAAAYSFNLYRSSQDQVQKLKANPQEVSKVEAKQLVETIGKLIDLPANEAPTVATVTNNKKLKNQAFFAKAENGDKVLIYTQSKMAILYNPAKNKIINVAPINIGPSPTPGEPTAVQPTTAPETTSVPQATRAPQSTTAPQQ